MIHEPARLVLVAHLYGVEGADLVFLMQTTALTWENLSSHLAKLEASGYVEIRKDFVERKPHTMVRLTSAGRAAFDAYRRQMRALFADLPDAALPSRRRRGACLDGEKGGTS